MEATQTFMAALSAFLGWSLQSGTLMAYVVFMTCSGMLGGALVALDACLVASGKSSQLELTHGWRRTPKAIIVWVMGGVLASGLGLVARIFDPTPLSALLAALTWRAFLKRLLSMAHHRDEQRLGPDGEVR